ncbi:MIP/aquaporin family protein [Balneola sp. MJW-20]|uniref:MIP/aquaporin family protein n=1 Tax=Gracilimonas aurantiaca TaxID=3234185 RepID=UPI0034662C05
MTEFWGEVLGTFLLLLLGNGVVANVILDKTKGNTEGFFAINWGWGIAVFVGVYTVAPISGAHINPAVTLGLAMSGLFNWGLVPLYIAGQFLGAMLGSGLVYVAYKDQFSATEDSATKRAVFCTAPEVRNYLNNMVSEIIATFVLVLGVLYLAVPDVGLGAISALPVALLVFGIGVSLGGPTGYAINPARDLGPRIMHALIPMNNKGDSDWAYSWVPVAGPVIGSALAALAYYALPF